MSSTSALPVTHVPCPTEWPSLSPSKISSHENPGGDSDWELIADDGPTQTSFERDAVCIDEPGKHVNESACDKPPCLHHAASTPNFFHKTILEESYDDAGAVLVENYQEDEKDDGVGSLASSSIVMVSGPSSVVSSQSVWSSASKISFRDAIMKEQDPGVTETDSQQETKPLKTVKKKPKFVVKPIKRCSKSTGDLQSLSRISENDDLHDDNLILGDTDAEMYYNQKAQGKLGRKNGRKIRPDEAKRLQITMAKKEDQRQRQAAGKRR